MGDYKKPEANFLKNIFGKTLKKVSCILMTAAFSASLVLPNKAWAVSSGKVVVYAPSPYSLNEKINEAFTEKTGIEVEAFNGTTGEILSKLEGEKANPSADVIIMSSWTDGMALQRAGVLMSYEPKGSEKLMKGFTDDKKSVFGFAASASGIIYNTNTYSELKEDWKELPEGDSAVSLVITDPRRSGSTLDFISAFVNSGGDDAWKIIEKMVSEGMLVAGTSKTAFDKVISGENSILIGAPDTTAYEEIENGSPIKVYYPKSGSVINPRPAMILNSAPNADNAKAYMDFLMTDEVQKMADEAFLIPGVEGFKTTTRPSAKDIPLLKYDWNWITDNNEKVSEQFKKIVEEKSPAE